MAKKDRSLHDFLIQEGINELNKSGFQNFSLRRVAERCNVSCAAPYRHFSDRKGLIAEILAYINRQWYDCLNRVVTQPHGSTRATIVAVSVAYIRFLLENPKFRAIIMQHGDPDELDPWRPFAAVSPISLELVDHYCAEVKMPPEVRRRKVFVMRSLIYGAALMLDNGELPADEQSMQMIEQALNREFDLA